MPPISSNLWTYLRQRSLRELAFLLLTSLMLLVFAKLVSVVVEGDTGAFDTAVPRALADPENPIIRTGPAWLESAVRDLTSLGSFTVLPLVVAAVLGFLVATRKLRTALPVLISVTGGGLLSMALKSYFQRERPASSRTASMCRAPVFQAATPYSLPRWTWTLGALLATVQSRALVRTYCISVAVADFFPRVSAACTSASTGQRKSSRGGASAPRGQSSA